MTSRLRNGRFVKKKIGDRVAKALTAMSEVKNPKILDTLHATTQFKIPDGNSIIELKKLVKDLKCTRCKNLLDMEKIYNDIHTAESSNGASDINTSIILGAIHAGVGNTGLNKILACANLPRITDNIYKNYEAIIGQAIELETKESCKRAASEEKELVIKNVKNLCDTLPVEIVQDIFPQLDILSLSSKDDQNLFNNALGEIINIIVSFDMGWSKRGNGRSYDSLNGYSTIIGFLSGKILDYATRNRKCKKCDLGHKKDDHDCRLNFRGSAKAMEADAGVQLVNHSNILKEAGLQVRVIVGDEDSSMIAAELYKIRDKFRELNKTNVISHIKKCFSYAVAQNKGNSESLARNLIQIPDHIFSRHENCGTWCNPSKNHTLKLSDETLYEELVHLFDKYAQNSHKFSIAASSQGNESFNNVVANKAPKNKCLSTSVACDIRVAEAVCAKNDGEQSILNIKQRLKIPAGSHTIKYVQRSEVKRQKRLTMSKSKTKKLRRIELKQKRELLRKNTERHEGITYESNCGMNKINNYVHKGCDDNNNSIINNIALDDETKIVYFDLETTGFAADAHILQIAATCDSKIFNIYVHTKTQILSSATVVTKLYHKYGNLFYGDRQVITFKISDALESFKQFLSKLSDGKQKCLLVAHNARFDVPRLLRAIMNIKVELLDLIVGFADTLSLFRKSLIDRKGPGQFKLESLSKDFLHPHNDQESFHDAAYDVVVLQDLIHKLELRSGLLQACKNINVYLEELSRLNKTKVNLKMLAELRNIISINMCKKLASNDISCDNLREIYKKSRKNAIVQLFSEKVDNKKVRITKNKKILTAILDFLENETSPMIKKLKSPKKNLKKTCLKNNIFLKSFILC
ncbi:uncharacterized protein LOC141533438 [Cotesia typhae]|uniref:uncharacterized protein LOC141533438 n=1 Tax=Cotesia typhae TaxID=2053667 RepID=UPI003D69D19F